VDLIAFEITQQQLKKFCQERRIRSLAIFGSVVRDDFGPNSDIDILVEFEPGYVPGYEFFSIEAELSQLLGRKVDLQTEKF
jgi:uncharacterized protein